MQLPHPKIQRNICYRLKLCRPESAEPERLPGVVGSGGTGGLQNLIRAYQVSQTEDQESLEGIVAIAEGFGFLQAFDVEGSRCLRGAGGIAGLLCHSQHQNRSLSS